MTTAESPFARVHRKLVAARIQFLSQLARFNKTELAQAAPGEEWSPLQVALHLYIADGLYLDEIKRVQQEDNPLIIDLEEETPQQTRAAEAPPSLDAVMAGMAARREAIFEYLSHLPEEAWERPFHHKRWGQLKFYQLINVLTRHDEDHAEQLVRMKAVLQ